MSQVVRVRRAGVVESVHRIDAAVVDADGGVVLEIGDPARVTYLRSAAKPLQAIPLIEDGIADRYGLTADEIAVCCASHNAEEPHLDRVRSILEKIGATPGQLACGAHAPLLEAAAARVRAAEGSYAPIHNNCSGKHAGMLALAAGHGWSLEGYHGSDHPVQRRMLAEVARWSGLDPADIQQGVDGCGVSTFAIPVRSMALAFARLARSAATGAEGSVRVEGARRIVSAMVRHPGLVAGTGRLDSALLAAGGGRLVVKGGTEGVLCAGMPNRGVGIALKVEDGGNRAAGPAFMEILDAIGFDGWEDAWREWGSVEDERPTERGEGSGREALERLRRPVVTNTRGDPVGRISAELVTRRP